jgi:hypothetical protein
MKPALKAGFVLGMSTPLTLQRVRLALQSLCFKEKT